jgi:hypothetical protein
MKIFGIIIIAFMASGCASVPSVSAEADKIDLEEKAPQGCEKIGAVRSSCSIIGEEWKADRCARNEFKEKVLKRGGNLGIVDSVIYAGFNRELVGSAYKCPVAPTDQAKENK